MRRPRSILSLTFVTLVTLVAPRLPAAAASGGIAWRDWSDGLFTEARVARRLVLLDLGAVWCHWCHVMDETTYRDPEVVRLLVARR
jgi:hypothetical protein